MPAAPPISAPPSIAGAPPVSQAAPTPASPASEPKPAGGPLADAIDPATQAAIAGAAEAAATPGVDDEEDLVPFEDETPAETAATEAVPAAATPEAPAASAAPADPDAWLDEAPAPAAAPAAQPPAPAPDIAALVQAGIQKALRDLGVAPTETATDAAAATAPAPKRPENFDDLPVAEQVAIMVDERVYARDAAIAAARSKADREHRAAMQLDAMKASFRTTVDQSPVLKYMKTEPERQALQRVYVSALIAERNAHIQATGEELPADKAAAIVRDVDTVQRALMREVRRNTINSHVAPRPVPMAAGEGVQVRPSPASAASPPAPAGVGSPLPPASPARTAGRVLPMTGDKWAASIAADFERHQARASRGR